MENDCGECWKRDAVSDTQVFKEFIDAGNGMQVDPLLSLLERLAGQFVGDLDLKGNSPLQDHLPQKHFHRLGHGDMQGPQHALSLPLRLFVNPYLNLRRLRRHKP